MALDIKQGEEILTLAHEMFAKIEQRETEAQKLGEAVQETKNTVSALSNRITEVETKDKRPMQGASARIAYASGLDEDEMQERKSLALDYVRKGYFRLKPEQQERLGKMAVEAPEGLKGAYDFLRAHQETKAMSIADDTLGGYFVLPEIIENEVIKNSVLYSPVREVARVIQTQNNEIKLSFRQSTLSAGWVSETGTRSESTGQAYGVRTINTFEMYALVLFSRQLLEDAYFNLEDELQADIAEQFGVLEGTAFVSGSGVGQPKGFVQDIPSGNIKTTASSTTDFTYPEAIGALGKLKPAYRKSPNCKWLLNQDTLTYARQIVDDQHRPMWLPNGYTDDNPPTILGKPYVEATDMDSIGASKVVMAVGDFTKMYRFVDRVGVTVQRLDQLYALSGQMGLLVHKRVGGMTVLPEAVAALKMHA